MNAMHFFTVLLEKEDTSAKGAVPHEGRILFIPHVSLHLPHNVVSWYVLRKYIKDFYNSVRKQTEVIVVRLWKMVG